jgi:hypothetical protein
MELEGYKEVLDKLAELNQEDGKKIARKGLRSASRPILGMVKQLAAKHKKSGTMDGNLKIRMSTKKGVVTAKIGASKKQWVSDAFYIPSVLFGHRVGKRPSTKREREALKKNDGRQFVPGDDFIEKAQEATQDAAVTAMTTTIEREIAKIANK